MFFLYFWFIFIGKLKSLIVTLEHNVKDLRDNKARIYQISDKSDCVNISLNSLRRL